MPLGPQQRRGLRKPLTVLGVAFSRAAVGIDAVGGAEQVLACIDRGLVEAGHRSIVVACRTSRVAGELVETGAVPDTIDGRARAQAVAATREAVQRSMDGVDLIHLHGLDFADVLPEDGPPALVTLHLPTDWYPSLEVKRARTFLHGVSEAQTRACRVTLMAPIANGVDVAALAGAAQTRRAFALTLGRVCPEKGQHLAIEAARRAGIGLAVAGAVFGYPEHVAYFEREVTPLLDRTRRFLGPVGFGRKRRLLSAARCLLVPSLAAETSSLVAMEAASCGTPVVAFRSGALADIVVDGVTGFLVDDAYEMAAAIGRVGEIDPRACREIATERFSMERMVARYVERYREIL